MVKPNPLPFLSERWAGVPKPTTNFKGRTVIVTGSNSGIGFEAAATFAELGADLVILAVRNVAKGEQARQKIYDRITQAKKVEVWHLDMADNQSILSFTQRVEKEISRLDVAVLNAGIISSKYVVGEEGWESMLQVNVVGLALLALLLLPKLKHPNE